MEHQNVLCWFPHTNRANMAKYLKRISIFIMAISQEVGELGVVDEDVKRL